MTAKHTPGPWTWEYSRDRKCIFINGRMAQVDADDPDPGEDPEANANLIAAAPEILEALKAFNSARSPEDWARATMLTDAAIAKAEGRI